MAQKRELTMQLDREQNEKHELFLQVCMLSVNASPFRTEYGNLCDYWWIQCRFCWRCENGRAQGLCSLVASRAKLDRTWVSALSTNQLWKCGVNQSLSGIRHSFYFILESEITWMQCDPCSDLRGHPTYQISSSSSHLLWHQSTDSKGMEGLAGLGRASNHRPCARQGASCHCITRALLLSTIALGRAESNELCGMQERSLQSCSRGSMKSDDEDRRKKSEG